MFNVTTDSSRHLVEFRVVGTLTDDEATELASAIRAAAATVKAGAGSFNLLANMKDAAVLPQAVASVGEAAMAWCAANGMTKLAAVAGSTIAMMQARRINPHDNYQGFLSREEALAWLES